MACHACFWRGTATGAKSHHMQPCFLQPRSCISLPTAVDFSWLSTCRPQQSMTDALLQEQPNQLDDAAEQQLPLQQQQLAESCRNSAKALSIDGPLAPYFSQQQQPEQQRPSTAPTTACNAAKLGTALVPAAEQPQHWQHLCNNELYGRSVSSSFELSVHPQQQQLEVVGNGVVSTNSRGDPSN